MYNVHCHWLFSYIYYMYLSSLNGGNLNCTVKLPFLRVDIHNILTVMILEATCFIIYQMFYANIFCVLFKQLMVPKALLDIPTTLEIPTTLDMPTTLDIPTMPDIPTMATQFY